MARPWSRLLDDVICTDMGFVSRPVPTPFPQPPSHQKAIKVCTCLPSALVCLINCVHATSNMLTAPRTSHHLARKLLLVELPIRRWVHSRYRLNHHRSVVLRLSQAPRTSMLAFRHRSNSSRVIIVPSVATLDLMRSIERTH
jgi:hypothetical protein